MKIRNFFVTSIFLVLSSCADDDTPAPDAGGSDFGSVTSAVVIVNPKINEGSTTTVQPGTEREDIGIKAGNMAEVPTDTTGLAVIKGLPTGTIPLQFSSGSIDLNVVQEKELYDVVVSYTTNGVAEIISAVRYPIGGTIVKVKPGDDLNTAIKEDGSIVFMAPGTYEGDVIINAEGVLLFGSWNAADGSVSIINGTLKVNGGNVRMRGVTVNGFTTVNANGFSAAFSEFNNANISGNSISLIRNTFNGTDVSVPSSSAVLLDNANIP